MTPYVVSLLALAAALVALVHSWRTRRRLRRVCRPDRSHCAAMLDRRIGELSRELPKAPNDGTRTGHRESSPKRGPDKSTQLADIGISKQRASEHPPAASLDELQALLELRAQVQS